LPVAATGNARLEATWAELELIGRDTGHVVARCPSCGSRTMVSILNASGTSRWMKSGGGWPRCKQCLAGRGKDGVRVEPAGDVGLVRRVRPGHGPTARQLALDRKAGGAPRKKPPR
jgi:hypothetical protein